jgi:hypothetical protein
VRDRPREDEHEGDGDREAAGKRCRPSYLRGGKPLPLWLCCLASTKTFCGQRRARRRLAFTDLGARRQAALEPGDSGTQSHCLGSGVQMSRSARLDPSKVSSFAPVPLASMNRLARLRRLLFGKNAPRARPHSRFHPIDTRQPLTPHSPGGEAFVQMQMHLAASLSALPGIRRSLRHLAHFEKSLVAKGSGALDALSIDRLRRAHAELAILLRVAPSSAGLISLERSMRDSLELRCSRRESNTGVQVSDGTLADFDQMVIDTDAAPLPDY